MSLSLCTCIYMYIYVYPWFNYTTNANGFAMGDNVASRARNEKNQHGIIPKTWTTSCPNGHRVSTIKKTPEYTSNGSRIHHSNIYIYIFIYS